jgi:hypothetical protein
LSWQQSHYLKKRTTLGAALAYFLVNVVPDRQSGDYASESEQRILLHSLISERSASQAKRNLASDLLSDGAFNNTTIWTYSVHFTLRPYPLGTVSDGRAETIASQ